MTLFGSKLLPVDSAGSGKVKKDFMRDDIECRFPCLAGEGVFGLGTEAARGLSGLSGLALRAMAGGGIFAVAYEFGFVVCSDVLVSSVVIVSRAWEFYNIIVWG